MTGHFRGAVGAGRTRGIGQYRVAAEAFDGFQDAGVIGGDDDIVEPLGLSGLFVDALDERFTGDQGERFAGKALCAVAGGDNPESANLHGEYRVTDSSPERK